MKSLVFTTYSALFNKKDRVMPSIKLFLISFLFVISQCNLIAQENYNLVSDKYIEIQKEDKSFYLINADSSKMKTLFQTTKEKPFYLLVFTWKYNIKSAEIIYLDNGSTKVAAKYSHRGPTSPMYVPIKFEFELPDSVKLFLKNSSEEIHLEFKSLKTKAKQLVPLIDKFGYIDWKTLSKDLR